MRTPHPALAATLLALSLLSAPSALSQNIPQEIVYGGDGSFAPYEFLDAHGEPAGLNVDLIRAVARVRGLRVRVVAGPWNQIRAGVVNGTIDIASMYRFPRREREFDFAISHELISHEMWIRRGALPINSLAELGGKRIVVEADALSEDAFTELGYEAALERVTGEPDALRALARGRGDVAVVTQTASRPFVERAELMRLIAPTGPPILLTEYAFVTRKGRRALIESINQGVAQVKASGEYQRIFDHWLRPDRSSGTLRLVAWITVSVIAVAVLIVIWNQLLRRRVAHQRAKIGALDASNRALERAKADLARANRELESFSYSVSHDLRAPLRAIGGYTHILMEDYEAQLDDEGKRVCRVICDNVRNMGQLIDDLLNFSRLSRATMETADIDMRALAEREFAALQAPESVELRVGPLPRVHGDPRLLHHVWTNLLSNAVKFSSRRERPQIQISGRETDGECLYEVRDNGAGFDARYADKLFNVFQRLHGADEFEGTGVGLAIVQRIVERHGGRVWAEGELDRGAMFGFALPKQPVS